MPFQVEFKVWQNPPKGWVGANKAQGPGWLNRNAFRAYADDLRIRVRKIRQKPPSDNDRRWLAAMSVAWKICLQGNLRMNNRAEALAAIVGEREYFNSVMQPVLYERFVRTLPHREASPPSLPDFMGILIPTFAGK
jgi:hypothetical protein